MGSISTVQWLTEHYNPHTNTVSIGQCIHRNEVYADPRTHQFVCESNRGHYWKDITLDPELNIPGRKPTTMRAFNETLLSWYEAQQLERNQAQHTSLPHSNEALQTNGLSILNHQAVDIPRQDVTRSSSIVTCVMRLYFYFSRDTGNNKMMVMAPAHDNVHNETSPMLLSIASVASPESFDSDSRTTLGVDKSFRHGKKETRSELCRA